MALIKFVRNYDDLSTSRGFQFEFYCDRCGTGYRTHFQASTTGIVTEALDVAGDFLGGVLDDAADLSKRVHSAAWEKAHDRAFAAAVGQGRVAVRSAVPHDAVSEVMSCIDLLVLPSRTTPRWKEQFGRVIIEALCCGVPVVGSDSGEIPVLLRRTGAGVIFREGDVPDLAEKLRAASDDYDRLRAETVEARRRIDATYSYRAVADKLYEICRGLAEASAQ